MKYLKLLSVILIISGILLLLVTSCKQSRHIQKTVVDTVMITVFDTNRVSVNKTTYKLIPKDSIIYNIKDVDKINYVVKDVTVENTNLVSESKSNIVVSENEKSDEVVKNEKIEQKEQLNNSRHKLLIDIIFIIILLLLSFLILRKTSFTKLKEEAKKFEEFVKKDVY